jgi:lipopolysaccharide/colanic/teichoic acid biosynthesis glycosyltransferase
MSQLYLPFFKRAFDIAVAATGIGLVTPLLVLCPIIIKLDSPGPAYFRQIRVGQHGRPFVILKFRSMVVRPGKSITAAGDPRITNIGYWLRKTKIDELPQLFNVLLGDMSMVGPRPELADYVAGYTAEQKHVLDLKPGITGPAAIGFIREEELLSKHLNPERFYKTSILPRKLELDLEYCSRVTFGYDVLLLLKTFFSIFFRPNSVKEAKLL